MSTLPVVKTCSCGRHFDASAWAELDLCGYVGAYEGSKGERLVVELRHCNACNSTIGIEVEQPSTAVAA